MSVGSILSHMRMYCVMLFTGNEIEIEFSFEAVATHQFPNTIQCSQQEIHDEFAQNACRSCSPLPKIKKKAYFKGVLRRTQCFERAAQFANGGRHVLKIKRRYGPLRMLLGLRHGRVIGSEIDHDRLGSPAGPTRDCRSRA